MEPFSSFFWCEQAYVHPKSIPVIGRSVRLLVTLRCEWRHTVSIQQLMSSSELDRCVAVGGHLRVSVALTATTEARLLLVDQPQQLTINSERSGVQVLSKPSHEVTQLFVRLAKDRGIDNKLNTALPQLQPN
jgi:hypothetical protein